MVTHANLHSPSATSLRSLVHGFVLTKQSEGKSQRTVEYYGENLRRFLWYADTRDWSDDIRSLTEWDFREFLAYVGNQSGRWGREGNGSETSRLKASHSTVHHYFVVLSTFFNWAVHEGFIVDNPLATIRVAKPKSKVIIPFTADEIHRMIQVCDFDYTHNAKFLGSRNRAIVLVLLDTGLRLTEITAIKLHDLDSNNGHIKVTGKGNKERIVRIGKTTQKAIWRYLMYRNNVNSQTLWLTEEGKSMTASSIQSFVKRLKQRAGVFGDGTVHRFRHTFALNFLRADRNVFNLQYLLGHSDLDMVRRYTTTLGMEDALEAHKKASPVEYLGLG
ncbi:MAG: tyrosine-type recombinase/integrase [Dehalococcoidia bacterium]|jgi:site-specific recombinase XerD